MSTFPPDIKQIYDSPPPDLPDGGFPSGEKPHQITDDDTTKFRALIDEVRASG